MQDQRTAIAFYNQYIEQLVEQGMMPYKAARTAIEQQAERFLSCKDFDVVLFVRGMLIDPMMLYYYQNNTVVLMDAAHIAKFTALITQFIVNRSTYLLSLMDNMLGGNSTGYTMTATANMDKNFVEYIVLRVTAHTRAVHRDLYGITSDMELVFGQLSIGTMIVAVQNNYIAPDILTIE